MVKKMIITFMILIYFLWGVGALLSYIDDRKYYNVSESWIYFLNFHLVGGLIFLIYKIIEYFNLFSE